MPRNQKDEAGEDDKEVTKGGARSKGSQMAECNHMPNIVLMRTQRVVISHESTEVLCA